MQFEYSKLLQHYYLNSHVLLMNQKNQIVNKIIEFSTGEIYVQISCPSVNGASLGSYFCGKKLKNCCF